MSYPAESSGSTSRGRNKVAHNHNHGPSGTPEFVISRFVLTVLLASILDHAKNTTFTNSQVNNMNINQVQACSTGVGETRPWFIFKGAALVLVAEKRHMVKRMSCEEVAYTPEFDFRILLPSVASSFEPRPLRAFVE